MQALAGELADGVIVVTGLEPDLVRATLARIGAGAARGGRNVDELDVCFGTYAHVTSDRREAARIVKPYVVATAQTGGQALLHGIGIEIEPPQRRRRDLSRHVARGGLGRRRGGAAEWVTDEQALRFADAFCLIGSPEELADRLQRRGRRGRAQLLHPPLLLVHAAVGAAPHLRRDGSLRPKHGALPHR